MKKKDVVYLLVDFFYMLKEKGLIKPIDNATAKNITVEFIEKNVN